MQRHADIVRLGGRDVAASNGCGAVWEGVCAGADIELQVHGAREAEVRDVGEVEGGVGGDC